MISREAALDVITDGLMNYVALSGDKSDVDLVGALYGDLQEAFMSELREGDVCDFAFPSMILRRDVRAPTLVVILQDRVVVAWQKGLFRKKLEQEVVSVQNIRDAWFGRYPNDSPSAPRKLVIEATVQVALALPMQNYSKIGASLRDRILERRDAALPDR